MGNYKSIIPSFEVLFILVFFVFFLIWMVPKCASTATGLQDIQTETEAKIDSLDRIMDSLITKPNLKPVETDSLADSKSVKTGIPPSATPTTRTAQPLGKLYITIDNLKLRKFPHLDSAVVSTLPLFDEVYFLEEITEFTQQISLGYEIADEPWVKIRTQKGLDGWVYGAGVHYYKKKRGGVME